MDCRAASRSLEERSAERHTVDKVLAIAGDLMSSTQTSLLDVLRKEWADAVDTKFSKWVFGISR